MVSIFQKFIFNIPIVALNKPPSIRICMMCVCVLMGQKTASFLQWHTKVMVWKICYFPSLLFSLWLCSVFSKSAWYAKHFVRQYFPYSRHFIESYIEIDIKCVIDNSEKRKKNGDKNHKHTFTQHTLQQCHTFSHAYQITIGISYYWHGISMNETRTRDIRVKALAHPWLLLINI